MTTAWSVPGYSQDADAQVDAMVSDQLVRYALASLQAGGEVLAEGQAEQAGVLLELATRLQPEDADVWRLRAYQAEAAGDVTAHLDALREYLRLRPSDDAALLQLMMLRVQEIETLDGRLEAIDRMMQGGRLSEMTPAVRSRLASSAAAIAQEMGDEPAYLRYLKQALRADPTNGEAALLAYEFGASRGADPLRLAAAAVNLVRARPMDPWARLRLAEALEGVGDYERAAAQYQVARRMSYGQPLPTDSRLAWARCLLNAGRSAEAVELLDTLEDASAEGDGPDAVPPLEADLLRHLAEPGDAGGEAALQRVIKRLNERVEAGEAEAKLDLAWVQAVFGDASTVAGLLKGQPQDDPRYTRAAGFVYLRDGSVRWARSAFERLDARDGWAAYGLAKVKGIDDAGRTRFLSQVVSEHPASFGAALAARDIHAADRRVALPGTAASLRRTMDRLPQSLWRMDAGPRIWTSLSVRFPTPQTMFHEPIPVRLTLTNHSDLPLALGEPGGLGDTLIVSLAAFSGGRSIGVLPPVVKRLARRLRLGPGERLELDLRLDRSVTALQMLAEAPGTYGYNASFTLDPLLTENGGVVSSPMGAFDTVRSLQLIVTAATPDRVAEWVTQSTDPDAFTRLHALARLARLGEGVRELSDIQPLDAQAAINAINDAYDRLPLHERAWVLMWLTAKDDNRSPYQRTLEQAKRSEQPIERIAYLLGTIDDASHPALSTAIRDGSPMVRRFAEARRAVLQSDVEDLTPVDK